MKAVEDFCRNYSGLCSFEISCDYQKNFAVKLQLVRQPSVVVTSEAYGTSVEPLIIELIERANVGRVV